MTDPATTVYGPFYRQESETQTSETVRAVLASGELHGRSRQSSFIPVVQAYRRPRTGNPGMSSTPSRRPMTRTVPRRTGASAPTAASAWKATW